jgi:hypothetical protein
LYFCRLLSGQQLAVAYFPHGCKLATTHKLFFLVLYGSSSF